MPRDSIRLLLVDDHPVARLGLAAILAEDPSLEIVGEASSVAEAVSAYTRLRPHVAVIDLRLPDGTALDAFQRVRARVPGAKVVVITGVEGEEPAYLAVQAGVQGYLSKAAAPRKVIDAIKRVAAGERVLGEAFARRVAARAEQPSLTARELDVLRLVVEGRSNPEICNALGLSLSTVRTHVAHILEKLGVADRTEAATLALRRGLLA